ncbi:MAG: hypothetical protein ACXAEX_21440 [Promethearchaeota archaeon]
MFDDLEETSFENVVLSFYKELLDIHRTDRYPDSMTHGFRRKLRTDGFVEVEKGQMVDKVFLTPKACNV